MHLRYFHSRKATILILGGLCFLLSSVRPGVAEARTGAIRGQVVDSSGAVLPKTAVHARNADSSHFVSARTDEVGTFEMDRLEPGSYRLTIERDKFQTVHQQLELSPGEQRQVTITLPVSPDQAIHERVMVIGDEQEVFAIPGSAHFISKVELDRQRAGFDDINRFLRSVPGVYLQEEEGFGRRPNISLRGVGGERSSKITMMEDGVLVAPAPYAAPAAYYFPITGRMEAIEVRKGSSQIKYGPRTNGGALNLISTSIPSSLRLRGSVAAGAYAARKAHVNVGDSYERFGWLFETYQLATDGFKRLDNGANTGFHVQDYLGKFRVNSKQDARFYQSLEIKIGRSKEDADETYLGLSEADFRASSRYRYASSQADLYGWNHQQYQARHFIALSPKLDLTTLVYRHNFARNWYKLGSVSGVGIASVVESPQTHPELFDVLRGGDSAPDALSVRANNRTYYSQGVQSILGLQSRFGGLDHAIETGFRFHWDEEDRYQHDDLYQMTGRTMRLTRPGAAGSQENRVSGATAQAFFVQDKIAVGRLMITPGLRFENIDFLRTDYAKDDPGRKTATTVTPTNVRVLIPGVGLTYDLSSGFTLLGGVHKGFSPPGPGSAQETKAEQSANSEFGMRLRTGSFQTQLVGFLTDYQNLLGRDTLSGGGQGTGNMFNGGAARVRGLEASAVFDLRQVLRLAFPMPLALSYTRTEGEFRNTFQSTFAPWGNVVHGDELPYLPRHQLHARIGLEMSRWRVDLESNYVSRMRTRAGSGPIQNLLATDSLAVLNLSGEYRLTEGTSLILGVQNLTDREYVVARQPAGARPGLPRTVMFGMKFDVGLGR
jgi:Fe(3+) dicitrate transport protein